MFYIATVEHTSLTNPRKIAVVGSLARAKQAAKKSLRAILPGCKLVIRDREGHTVAYRPSGSRKWETAIA